MPRRLLIINALLLAIAGASLTYIVRQVLSPMPMPASTRNRPAPTAATAAEQAPPSQPGAYAAVAARNVFSPTRTETPPSATTAAAPAAVKPSLFGVVLRDGAPIAYLEDPTTKRVAGYRVGDAMVGGTVQTISADGVVIARPDGNMDVRLRDPSRPRPAATVGGGAQPGLPGAGVPPMLPGVIPPAGAPAVPGQIVGQPPVAVPVPGQIVQPAPATPPVIPGRRPLPPNLLRRLPQGLPTDAQPQPRQ
jgi:hypothetical protein